MIFKIVECFLGNIEFLCFNPIIFTECKTINATVRGDILILFSYRFLKKIEFNMTCFFCKICRGDDVVFMRMKRFKECTGKAPDEPRPVPAGISARLAISRYRASNPNNFKAHE